MDLAALEREVARRQDRWQGAAAASSITLGPATDKPGAWLDLSTPTAAAQLTVWTSGEAEVQWGYVAEPLRTHAASPVLRSAADVGACLDELEDLLGLNRRS